MVFVTVDEDRVRLETLTRLLVCTFPGSVIYQYTDPVFAIINMEKRKIDVVFVNLNILQKTTGNSWNYCEGKSQINRFSFWLMTSSCGILPWNMEPGNTWFVL